MTHNTKSQKPSAFRLPTGNVAEWLQALQWRYAVKRFDPDRKISSEIWSSIEQSLVLTPSSFGLQPWRFIVVTDPQVKAQLPSISWGQSQPKDCSHMVILASVRELDAKYLDRFLESVAKTRDVAIETLAGYRQVVLGFIQNHHHRLEVWGAHQAYIALGQLMATAAYLGIDACPMEGIDASKYDALLGLQDSPYATRVACALGYRHPEDRYAQQSKVRFDVEEVIHRI